MPQVLWSRQEPNGYEGTMKRGRTSRLAIVALFLGAVAALGAGVWRYGYGQALDQLAKQGQADLALASDRVVGQLQRYRELAVLLSDHPAVAVLSAAPARASSDAASALFQRVADKTSALEVLYVDRTGTARAAARSELTGTRIDTPFVDRAMQGALGWGHGADVIVTPRAYYYAAPFFDGTGKVQGAVIVAADIAEIEWDWTGSNPAVFFTDVLGSVLITNRSELTTWRRPVGNPGLAPPKGPSRPLDVRYMGPHELWKLEWGPYLPDRALHLTRALPVIGLKAEALIDTAPALRLAGLQAAAVMALCLAFGALLFLATERRRALAEANAELEEGVATRTKALSETNIQLRREITEREDAEAALRQAQADLVQAGKLSALGQMSAGISHELNQPLMAIQSFADNGAAFLDRGRPEQAADNLGRIADLTHRMGRIIKNLRAFVRNESEPMGKVDLVQVVNTAVELTEARLRRDDVVLEWDQRDAAPVLAWGGEVRLVQVFVNLINNAADAMMAQDRRSIRIALDDGAKLAVYVQDIGPGIQAPDKIFEPFYSTKAVSEGEEGMGLGLSISYGLVQSFGGRIQGENTDTGARFTVELERWSEAEAAE
jgi:two-component system C4-dicarboxylate transport sensor histidine kinase DctB